MRHGGAWLRETGDKYFSSATSQPTRSELEMTVVQPRLAVMSHLGSGRAYAIRPAPPGCHEIYIFHMHIGKPAGASGVEDNRPGCASTAWVVRTAGRPSG